MIELKVKANEFEVVKDGIIVAEAKDRITLEFEDLTFVFKILNSSNVPESNREKISFSEDKKTANIPIYIQWNNLSTTFSSRIALAKYKESELNKELSIAYAISGLQGDDLSGYIFRYTLYSNNI